jgi:hypothetical protein
MQDLELRRAVVQWIARLAHDFDFRLLTVHMAVEYYDRLKTRRTFRFAMLPIVAASCLLVAAKSEEDPEKIPSLSELLIVMGTPASFSRRSLAACELEVLQLLGWSLRCATRLHFLHAFHALGLSSPQDELAGRPPTLQEQEYVVALAGFFCDVAVQHPEIAPHEPELAAAASVAAARSLAGVRPVWPDQLSGRFGHSDHDIAPCCRALLDEYHATYSDRSGDVSLPGEVAATMAPADAQISQGSSTATSISPTNIDVRWVLS